MGEAVTPDEETVEMAVYRTDPEVWAPIATWAEGEPEKALNEFELSALRILNNKPRNMGYWLQKAIGQYDKRVGAAALALSEAEKHKPADGWREPVRPVLTHHTIGNDILEEES